MQARADLSLGSYWRQEFSQQCYAGAHKGLVVALGIPGLALLAVGWPVICAVWLSMNAEKLYVDPSFTGMFSFIFEGYQAR